MGLWNVITGTAGKAISDPIKETGVALDNLFTSDEERLAFLEKYNQIIAQINQSQVELNKVEAQSGSWWNSGWRPALGWSCAISVAINFITQAVVTNYVWVVTCLGAQQLLPYPAPHALIELTAGILGIYGTQKTFEKIKGVG